MWSSRPLKLAVGAALLLSALVLFAGPALAVADTQPARDPAGANSFEGGRGDAPENFEGGWGDAPEDDARDRRVLAALIFTVVGTIGLITIGSVVLLTQPGDRQVMMVVEPGDPPEESVSG